MKFKEWKERKNWIVKPTPFPALDKISEHPFACLVGFPFLFFLEKIGVIRPYFPAGDPDWCMKFCRLRRLENGEGKTLAMLEKEMYDFYRERGNACA